MEKQKKILTYGNLVRGECTYVQYIRNCYERNSGKEERCFRQMMHLPLCPECPKINEPEPLVEIEDDQIHL